MKFKPEDFEASMGFTAADRADRDGQYSQYYYAERAADAANYILQKWSYEDMTVFPDTTETTGKLGTYVAKASGGLSKRELFAAMAMQSIMSATGEDGDLKLIYPTRELDTKYEKSLVEAATRYADALIKELSERSDDEN